MTFNSSEAELVYASIKGYIARHITTTEEEMSDIQAEFKLLAIKGETMTMRFFLVVEKQGG